MGNLLGEAFECVEEETHLLVDANSGIELKLIRCKNLNYKEATCRSDELHIGSIQDPVTYVVPELKRHAVGRYHEVY